MVLSIVGVMVLALGLVCGGVMVAVPLGLASLSAGPVLWVLFPAFCLGGFALLATGARPAALRGPMRAVSVALLALALASAAGLVMTAAAMREAAGSTLPLWYVLAIAGTLGTVGAAVTGRAAG
ncbi:MAG: hypothetical protein RJA99_1322 [Pseudomonadota bacterium]|jgi:hypothetical protein